MNKPENAEECKIPRFYKCLITIGEAQALSNKLTPEVFLIAVKIKFLQSLLQDIRFLSRTLFNTEG